VNGAAPIVRLALAYGAGLAVGLAGAPIWMAPLLGVGALLLPIAPWRRPVRGVTLALVSVGWISWILASAGGCAAPEAGARDRIVGHFVASPRTGSAPFERADRCGAITVVVPDSLRGEKLAGRPATIVGVWRAGSWRPWFSARSVEELQISGAGRSARLDEWWWRITAGVQQGTARWRDELVSHVHGLYGARAPLVAALVFARREGLERDLREDFAVSGIAHLLAISGFHVGVIAGLALALLRAAHLSRRRAGLGAAAFAWLYVGFIGFPDAACRAAFILGVVAISRSSGRPPTRWSALAGAALALLVTDPTRLASAGFQLSFAGAAGLIAWSGPLERALDRRGRRALTILCDVTSGRVDVRRPPRVLVSAVSAGVAATVATVPIVAWHFGRVSLVGIPATLVASPLVSLALPGALTTVILDPVAPRAAAFLAGGVEALLDVLVLQTSAAASLPWASLWVSRATVIAATVGVLVARRIALHPRIGGVARRRLVVAYGLAGVLLWPVALAVGGRGSLELLFIDVGQGDAIAVKTPAGRWLLIDTGRPGPTDPGAHPVVRALRARGVSRLETLVLTHADADHFGGAPAILRSFEVRRVYDPMVPAPKRAYAEVLDLARRMGTVWEPARSGWSWSVDGVTMRVMHPPPRARAGGVEVEDANASSVVLLLTWEEFDVLLTGDAYVEVERSIMREVGDIEVLKVGHHGSTTSSDSTFLRAVDPEIAVISVGRGNRYGHPAPSVLRRLEAVDARILRTDLHGDVRLMVDRAGRLSTSTSR